MNPIEYIKYEKMVDDLYILGNNVILKFNVTLAKKSEDGRRFHFHKEYEYQSGKYADMNSLVTIKRNFDFFLSLENIRADQNGNKEFIMIRAQDMIHVQDRLNKVANWFLSAEFENLYARTKDNKLIIIGGNRPDSVHITGLCMDKSIVIDPIVINYDNNYMPGIRICLGSMSNYIDITVDRFMGLLYIINTMNLYQSAQIMLNYLQRPELGTNMYNFNTNDAPQENLEGHTVSNTINRKPTGVIKQRSFFDKIEEL